jgi:LuxR family transcriptional regulator, maltose regulon positive regulatory protein
MPRLVLVSAPAGFGKTTLLTQWLTSQDTGDGRGTPAARVAWLSLDAADSDPRLFLPHLVAALQIVSPKVGFEALTLMDTGREFPRDIASHRAWRIRRPAVRRTRRSRAAMAGRQ